MTGALGRVLAAILLTAVLFLVRVTVRRWAGYEGFDPYCIDYNQQGIDITSEGP